MHVAQMSGIPGAVVRRAECVARDSEATPLLMRNISKAIRKMSKQ